MSADLNKQVATGVIEWLQKSISDGSVREDDKEGLETAMQIIEEAFALTAASNATYSLKPSSLSQLVQVYQKTKAASTSAPTASASKPTSNARDKAAAEDAKTKGNQAMAAKNYQAAIDAYGEAIAKDDANPVYYSNRAAAYSQMGKQDEAIADAQKAAEVDPTFSKAYSRLGHAYYCAGKFAESVEAYEKGLELDPDNQTMKNSLATARSRLPNSGATDDAEDDNADTIETDAVDRGAAGRGGGMPDLASLLGGLGGGRGAGGMPDLSSILSNPAMMQMAQGLMANGGLDRMMQDPSIRQMAESFGRDGGMPDMANLMNNPALRNMAEQMGRGRGGGSGDSNMHS